MDWSEEKEKLGKEIAESLYDAGMIDTWYRSRPEGWTLISGLWSPIYINFRPFRVPIILESVKGKM